MVRNYKCFGANILAGLIAFFALFSVSQAQAETSYIIVHAHNPEGVEIASIEGMSQSSVEIYDGGTPIGYGAYNAETHNIPIAISPGTHTIKAEFNGMTKEQTITLNPGETKVVTFTFIRTEISNDDLFTTSASNNVSKSYTIDGEAGGWWYASSESPLYVMNMTSTYGAYHSIILQLNKTAAR